MAVRIANVVEDVILDSEAAVSVITKKKALQLGLDIDPVNTLNLTAYGSPLGVVGTVKQAPLRIKDAKIPIDLQVVNATEGSILLGMDWFNQYKVCLNIAEKTLEFESQEQKYQTLVEFTPVE